MQKSLVECSPTCLFFVFVICAFVVKFFKNIGNTDVKEQNLNFSSRSFMVCGLRLKYLTYFELIFAHGLRWGYTSIFFLHVTVQFS